MQMVKTMVSAAAASAVVLLVGPADAADMKSFEAAYAAADAARKEAGKLGFEWRDTGKMLQQAKALADKGELDAAEKLAHAARQQGEAAVAQAETQEAAWKAAVLR